MTIACLLMVLAVSQVRIGSRRIKQGVLLERPIPTESKEQSCEFQLCHLTGWSKTKWL